MIKTSKDSMKGYFLFGRRHNDIGLMIDFNKTRAIVRANTAWVDGIALEEIPTGMSGYCQGMVLVHKDWLKVYFLVEREDWSDENYFKFAKKLIDQKGIKKP